MGAVTLDLDFSKVNPKQKLALEDKHKYIGYGGARGGGILCRNKGVNRSTNLSGTYE